MESQRETRMKGLFDGMNDDDKLFAVLFICMAAFGAVAAICITAVEIVKVLHPVP